MKNLINLTTSFLLLTLFFFQLVIQKTSAQTNFTHDSLLRKMQLNLHKINLKPYILPGSTMFVSGLLDGTIESIKFHYYSGFKARFIHANDHFWNPDVSWTNKYKNGNPADGPKFFGSTNALVCTTDAYHGLRTAKNLINTFTVVFYINRVRSESKKIKIRKILLDALILTTIRNIGFTATYSVIFKSHE